MEIRDDDRGQAIQIGAVLLFAVLVIAFSLYQAYVVPNQNEQIEADHLRTVEGDMLDLRSGIVSVPMTGNGRSVRVTLGTTYPARAVALNPPPPSGHLRTLGTSDNRVNFTIANARAIDPETADYWNGTNRTRATGSVVYEPNYYEFRDPPDLVYDSSTLLSRFDDATLWASGQTVFDGQRITLVALDGDYDRSSSQSLSVDLDPISASTTDVAITNETDENVTVQFASQRNASAWRSLLLEEEQWYNQSGSVVDVRAGGNPNPSFDLVTVELEQDRTYTLRMAKVGMGTNVERTNATYLTDLEGNGRTVPEGGKTTLTVEVRDAFNNPITDARLVAGSQLENATVTPSNPTVDSSGQATLTYTAPDDISGTSQQTDHVQVSLDRALSAGVNSSGFNGSTAENVSMDVRITNTDGFGNGDNSANSIRYNGDGTAVFDQPSDATNSGVLFSITNIGDGNVTLSGIGIDSQSNAEYVYEGVGTDDSYREVHIFDDNPAQRGYLETGDDKFKDDRYVLGSGVVSLTESAEIASGEKINILSFYFRGKNKNDYIDMSGETVRFTLEFSDGSTKEIAFTG